MKVFLTTTLGHINSVIKKFRPMARSVSKGDRSDESRAKLVQSDVEVNCQDLHDLENIAPH